MPPLSSGKKMPAHSATALMRGSLQQALYPAPSDVTVRVGPGETAARYRAADPAEVIDLLGRIATVTASPT